MQSDSGEKARLGNGCPDATDEGTCEQRAEVVDKEVEDCFDKLDRKAAAVS